MRLIITLIVGVAFLGVLISSATYIPAVQDRLFSRAIDRALNADTERWFRNDGLAVIFCGTSSPIATPKRAQSCTAIIAGDNLYLFDAGTGGWEVLQSMGVPAGRLQAVFLTHFHSDHIGDLSEANLMSWIGGRQAPLSVYGPTGVDRVINGLNEAFALDNEYRTEHHGKAIAPPRTAGMSPIVFEGAAPQTVFERDGLKVTAFPVDHGPVKPSMGYRIDYEGRSVVISGDTSYSTDLIVAAEGADLLIHEAQANHMVKAMQETAAEAGNTTIAKILEDIQNYHTSPVEAAQAANDAGVDWLVLTHLTPPPDNPVAQRIFMRGVSKVRPRHVKLAEDGMVIILPKDGDVEFAKP